MFLAGMKRAIEQIVLVAQLLVMGDVERVVRAEGPAFRVIVHVRTLGASNDHSFTLAGFSPAINRRAQDQRAPAISKRSRASLMAMRFSSISRPANLPLPSKGLWLRSTAAIRAIAICWSRFCTASLTAVILPEGAAVRQPGTKSRAADLSRGSFSVGD